MSANWFTHMDVRVAVLVDGSFFLKRLRYYKNYYFSTQPELTAKNTVAILQKIVSKHLYNDSNGKHYNHLYRTFFYDSEPYAKKGHYPLPAPGQQNPQAIDFGREPIAIFRKELLEELKKQRKLALRLGTLKSTNDWVLKKGVLKQLLSGERDFNSLTNYDFSFDIRQKGVDIKLGIDIATLSYQKHVDKIILIAGDTDFVPAAKLARINGVEFVLDALRNHIDASLHEHIDGLVNFDLVALLKEQLQAQPDKIPSWWNEGANPKKPKQRRRKPQNR